MITYCNLPPLLSRGLSAGRGAVAAVHAAAGGNGGNWADAGSNTRKQVLVANKKPTMDSEPVGRVSILYYQCDSLYSWVGVQVDTS
jgi:hypothetical protein